MEASTTTGSFGRVGRVQRFGRNRGRWRSFSLWWCSGSIAIPVKAAAMNLLSMGAAYGVIVAVCQWGWLAAIFGASPGPIDPWIPLMMFTIVFGLPAAKAAAARLREPRGR